MAKSETMRVQSEGAVIDLSGRAQLRLTGADRVRYLNGQVTNDLRKLKPGGSLYACVTNAKGKLCGDCFVTLEPEALRIDCEAALREPMLARLERYIISDDAVLEDVSGQFAFLHLIGKAAEGIDGVRSKRFGMEGLDWIGSQQEKEALLARGLAPLLDEPTSELLRIQQGIPRWGYELDENTLPMEAGLEKSAIDFHKGCYIGQEVISRIKSIGHVNRRLCRFSAEVELARGMELVDPSGNRVGQLTSAAATPAGTFIALGYLKRGASPEIRLAQGGAAIGLAELE